MLLCHVPKFGLMLSTHKLSFFPPLFILQFLYNSVLTNDLPGILCAIAHGGSTNYVNREDGAKSPILLAAEAVSYRKVTFLCAWQIYANLSKWAA